MQVTSSAKEPSGRGTARARMSGVEQARRSDDDEEIRRRFDAIVGDWDVPIEPEPDGAPEPASGIRSLPVAPGVDAPWRGSTGSLLDGVLAAGVDDDEDGAAHDAEFVPPRPALPLASDTGFWVATIGLVAGPALLLWVAFFDPGASPWWMWLGIALAAAGFGVMVMRQPRHRQPIDDDHPDGARV